ncbi:hypothetical protein [Falsarthrobacter nasiphocae]|uniref:Uncharacterized protein n=1 Tax=Falsarthrobacter nasiphocae TaxID=189863 RepID=A0AAE3YDG5_9MICC|nr:hypothetical protein [Falsarthrobacter nasiphocae]MDR6891359.1 hypothetical protein [Falsarthrobacter nasiphocae]
MVAFHAIVLLSANRAYSGEANETEDKIRQTLDANGMSIVRPTFATWIVIIEKILKHFRDALGGDADDEARVRRSFASLNRIGVTRLISSEVVQKFKEINIKRNEWVGHSGYMGSSQLRV